MDLKRLVKQIDDAFTLPMVMQEVLDSTYDANANARKVSKAIARDPVLTAKVLRAANSSFFGFLFKTKELHAAVVRLGVRQVRQLTVALSVAKLFAGEAMAEGYSRVNVWEHSVAVAIMNELLAKVLPVPELRRLSGEALIAGLVHDIGIIFEDQYLPEKQFRPLTARVSGPDGWPLHLQEQKALGFDHAALGAKVLNKWRLPAEIAAAVERHHQPPGEDAPLLVQLTALAEMLASTSGIGYIDAPRVNRRVFDQLQKRLRLAGKPLRPLRENFPDRVREALEVFSLEAATASSGE